MDSVQMDADQWQLGKTKVCYDASPYYDHIHIDIALHGYLD